MSNENKEMKQTLTGSIDANLHQTNNKKEQVYSHQKKPLGKRHLAAAFLSGCLFFTGVAGAATQSSTIETVINKYQLIVNGKSLGEQTEGQINDDSMIPQTLLYKNTLYAPVRKVGELLDTRVRFDNENQMVIMDNKELVVPLTDSSGGLHGVVILHQREGGVHIRVEAAGLTPGDHGFHVHEKPIVNQDFATAGGHFNPLDRQHGHENPSGHHLGDIPNLTIKADGTGSLQYVIEGVTLDEQAANSILGRSFIIHEKADDGLTDPSGNSGDRIAGGTIK